MNKSLTTYIERFEMIWMKMYKKPRDFTTKPQLDHEMDMIKHLILESSWFLLVLLSWPIHTHKGEKDESC